MSTRDASVYLPAYVDMKGSTVTCSGGKCLMSLDDLYRLLDADRVDGNGIFLHRSEALQFNEKANECTQHAINDFMEDTSGEKPRHSAVEALVKLCIEFHMGAQK